MHDVAQICGRYLASEPAICHKIVKCGSVFLIAHIPMAGICSHAMQLTNKTLKSDWVRFELMKPNPDSREFIKSSGAIQAMWDWLPRLPSGGTNFDAYFDHTAAQMKSGRMIPVMGFSKSTDAFIGGAAFLQINRTHRNLQIGFMWSPKQYRGSPYTLAIQAAMMQAALDWRAKRIFWTADGGNARLISFLEEKVRAKKEGEFRSVFRMTDGRWSDVHTYALVGDEIAEAIAKIESELEIEFSELD